MVFGLSLCLSGRQARREGNMHWEGKKGFTRKFLWNECDAFVFCLFSAFPSCCCLAHVSDLGSSRAESEVEWVGTPSVSKVVCVVELWCGVLIGGVQSFSFQLRGGWSCITRGFVRLIE